MTELYALTTTAKENLSIQIQTKTSEVCQNYPAKGELDNFQVSDPITITITQEDIEDLLSNDSQYTETTVFKNDTVAIVLGPQYETLDLPDTIKYVFFGDRQHTIKSEQFMNKQNLKHVIGKNISTIQARAFSGSGLESFYVQHDSSVMFILEDQAFKNCWNLYAVDLDVALTYIPYECFFGCGSLRSFKIYHPELLKKLYTGCFAQCFNLEYIFGIDEVELNAIDNNCFDKAGLVYLGLNGPNIQYIRGGADHLVYQNDSLRELKINFHTLHPGAVMNAPKLQYFRVGPNSRCLHEHILNDCISPYLIWIDCDYPNLESESDWNNPDWTYFNTVRMITYRNSGCTLLPTYSVKYNDKLTFFEVPQHIQEIKEGAIYSNNTIETLLLHEGQKIKTSANPFGIIRNRILILIHSDWETELYYKLISIYGEDKVKRVESA